MSSAGQTWSYTDEQQACIRICEDLVEQRMRNLDGSHDSLHVYRVRSLALKIADTVLGADRFVVEVAALLHDLYDKKYNETNVTDQRFFLSDLLCKSGIDLGVGNDIIEVAQNISYSSEVKAEANGFTLDLNPRLVPSWSCVHDADYLDAIGAIGVLRTSAFAGVRGNRLYVPEPGPEATPDDWIVFKTSCIQHFHDKLLKLTGRMKTDEGNRLARSRHRFMCVFLEQLQDEIDISS